MTTIRTHLKGYIIDDPSTVPAEQLYLYPKADGWYMAKNNSPTPDIKRLVTDSDLLDYVPYIGADKNVDLGSHTLRASQLIVGNQTNRATIQYTTDQARILTIPALGGNRTFAFLDQSQTFTENQTFDDKFTNFSHNSSILNFLGTDEKVIRTTQGSLQVRFDDKNIISELQVNSEHARMGIYNPFDPLGGNYITIAAHGVTHTAQRHDFNGKAIFHGVFDEEVIDLIPGIQIVEYPYMPIAPDEGDIWNSNGRLYVSHGENIFAFAYTSDIPSVPAPLEIISEAEINAGTATTARAISGQRVDYLTRMKPNGEENQTLRYGTSGWEATSKIQIAPTITNISNSTIVNIGIDGANKPALFIHTTVGISINAETYPLWLFGEDLNTGILQRGSDGKISTTSITGFFANPMQNYGDLIIGGQSGVPARFPASSSVGVRYLRQQYHEESPNGNPTTSWAQINYSELSGTPDLSGYLTGSLTENYIPVADAGGNLVDSLLYQDSVNGRIGLGTDEPDSELSVYGQIQAFNEVSAATVHLVTYNTPNVVRGGLFVGYRARGTKESPSATQTGDYLTSLGGRGYGTTGFSTTNRAGVGVIAANNWTDASQGASVVFDTNPIGSAATAVTRMIITHDGNVGIGTTDPQGLIHVVRTSSGESLINDGIFTGGGFPYIQFRRAQGTPSAMTAITTSMILGGYFWDAYNGTAFNTVSSIRSIADGANDSAAILFHTRPAAGSNTERMRLTGGGNLGIGITPTERLHVDGNILATGHLQATHPEYTDIIDNMLVSDGGVVSQAETTDYGFFELDPPGLDELLIGDGLGGFEYIHKDLLAGHWTKTGNDIYYNGGQVWIGTDDGDERLHLHGGLFKHTSAGSGHNRFITTWAEDVSINIERHDVAYNDYTLLGALKFWGSYWTGGLPPTVQNRILAAGMYFRMLQNWEPSYTEVAGELDFRFPDGTGDDEQTDTVSKFKVINDLVANQFNSIVLRSFDNTGKEMFEVRGNGAIRTGFNLPTLQLVDIDAADHGTGTDKWIEFKFNNESYRVQMRKIS